MHLLPKPRSKRPRRRPSIGTTLAHLARLPISDPGKVSGGSLSSPPIFCRSFARYGALEVQRGTVRVVELRIGAEIFRHWTPFNDLAPGEASSPAYRHAIERQHAKPDVPYGLDVYHGGQVLSVLWSDDGASPVVAPARSASKLGKVRPINRLRGFAHNNRRYPWRRQNGSASAGPLWSCWRRHPKPIVCGRARAYERWSHPSSECARPAAAPERDGRGSSIALTNTDIGLWALRAGVAWHVAGHGLSAVVHDRSRGMR